MPRHQQTIANAAEVNGRGLFSGAEVQVRLCPAEANTGILFVRMDLPDRPVVPCTAECLGTAFRATLLRRDDLEIHSIEHLLSACVGLGVDNLVVELDAEEVPAAGGCPFEFAQAMLEAGIEEQSAEKTFLKIQEPLAVSEGESSITGMPSEEGLTVSCVLEFDHADLSAQVFTARIDPDTYMRDIAPARTFAFELAYEEFAERGFGGGVTDENALVIFRDGSVRKPLSREDAELRFANEFARHKVADLLGDLAPAGVGLEGKIVAVRTGHRLNAAVVNALCRILKAEGAPEPYLDIREIRRILPHRYPFLLVDRILRVEEEGKKITGLKNVSFNEHFFQGHLPGYPVMPGVLQLEALAQVAGVLLLRTLEHTGKVALLVSMDAVKLRRPVIPGDQLILEAEAVRVRSRSAQVNGRASVNGETSCEAEMKFMMVEAEDL